MFQNSYQNGAYFQLFDPKASQDKTKNLFKLQNVPGNNKIFDKQLKTYIFDFNSASSKIVFPKQDRKQLYLIQQYLNFQIFFYEAMSWSIELTISDLNKTKRRIMLSPATKVDNKPFFVKFPCSHVQEGLWTNLTVDLYSFIFAFKGQTYRSLDMITINGFFKLRRIYTTQEPPVASANNQQIKTINILPKALLLPTQIECANCMIIYEETSVIGDDLYEPTETSSKNKSNVLSRHQISTPKTEIIRPEKKGYPTEKKFLADTNGPEKKNRKKVQKNINISVENQKIENKSRYTDKPPAISSQKTSGQRKNVGKSQAHKFRSSIQKKKPTKQQEKVKLKSKLNPWRSSKKNQTQTDGSQLSQTKPIGDRKTQSAETTLFKTKNNLANKFNQSNNKGFQHRSDHYSDSQYIELSQKFSTLTEGRFFKNQLGSQMQAAQRDPQQIQQHIQLESNEMCESSNRKYVQNQIIKELKNHPIEQSISDSLNNIGNRKNISMIKDKQSKVKIQQGPANYMMNSYYGFGQKLMNKYMEVVERPYSPPLCEKQLTQQMSEQNDGKDDKQVQLIYDPVLNCYYDHKTHTYYELKN